MNQLIKISILFGLLHSCLLLRAQDTKFVIIPTTETIQDTIPTDSSASNKSNVKQIDLIDIAHSILYAPKNRPERLDEKEPGKTLISVVPAIGYTLQTGFAALISGNVAYYKDTSAEQKLSSVSASFTYTQYKQFIVPVQASVWTKENKSNYLIDWRYMHYPSTTYGLGGQTRLSDGYTIDFSYAKIHQSVFKNIRHNLYGGLGYYFDYFWNIKEVGLSPNDITVFQQYGLTSKEIASGPAFRILYDSRLNQVNPHNGFFTNIVYRPNFKFLGSQSNWQSLLLEFRKYIKLRKDSKNVLALWSYNWLTTGGKPPYLLLPSTGWDDSFNTGRGYIQGRFRGRNMIYLETEYRFGITRNGLFGGVVFANVQSFSTESSFTISTINPAYGAGLRIKLNKFSGANLCIDYGIGTHGSKGFFVNLNEVF